MLNTYYAFNNCNFYYYCFWRQSRWRWSVLWLNNILCVPCNRAVNKSKKPDLPSQFNHDVSNHLCYQKQWTIDADKHDLELYLLNDFGHSNLCVYGPLFPHV